MGTKEKESIAYPELSVHKEKYFELREGLYLVPGITRAAICDTKTGNVYSINRAAMQVVLDQRKDEEFWQELQQLGLMNGEQMPRSIEKEKPQFRLEFVWFEIISDDCNERCLHCYANSMPPTYRKLLGLVQNNPDLRAKTKLSSDRWKDLIRESNELGCRQCQFIGGEPFVWRGDNGETVLDLAQYARELGYAFIEIFTNAAMITPKEVARIKELTLHIAVSLYSNDPKIHDQITRTPGSFKKTMRALELLKEASVPTRVETVLMRPNQHTIETTNELIWEMGFVHRAPDVLRPKGRGDSQQLEPDPGSLVRYGLILGPDFSAQPGFFQRSVDGHNCLAGKITITDNGNVLPCIFSREQIVGNVRMKSIGQVLERKKIQQIWSTTKDDVIICQDCEYRYVCFDCRPLSEGATCGHGDYLTAPYPRCTYNPYHGEWENGTWKLDEQGRPYYDESLKPMIENVRAEGILVNQTKGH